MSTPSKAIQQRTEVLIKGIGQEKQRKGIQTWKEEEKSEFANDLILHEESHKDFQEKLIEYINSAKLQDTK